MSYEQYVDTLKYHSASKDKLEETVREMSKLISFASRLIDGYVISAFDGMGVQWPRYDYTTMEEYTLRPVDIEHEDVPAIEAHNLPNMADLVVAINEYHDSISNAQHAYRGLDNSEFAVKPPKFPQVHTTAKAVDESEA